MTFFEQKRTRDDGQLRKTFTGFWLSRACATKVSVTLWHSQTLPSPPPMTRPDNSISSRHSTADKTAPWLDSSNMAYSITLSRRVVEPPSSPNILYFLIANSPTHQSFGLRDPSAIDKMRTEKKRNTRRRSDQFFFFSFLYSSRSSMFLMGTVFSFQKLFYTCQFRYLEGMESFKDWMENSSKSWRTFLF